jgi:hypothetical protein
MLEDGGSVIRNADAPSWRSRATDRFHSVRDSQRKRWFDSSDNVSKAHRIFREQAEFTDWAHRERLEARAGWNDGYRLTEQAVLEDPHLAMPWRKRRTAELIFGLAPKPLFAGDVGAEMRTDALVQYEHAKSELAKAAAAAAKELDAVTALAPMRRFLLGE